jgi:tetrahydromethanopterin S-methyltransferase subunit G
MITNEIIEEKFKDIKEYLERIEKQVTKTNGTVAGLVEWKNFSKGAITVISCFVVPVLLYLLYLHLKI